MITLKCKMCGGELQITEDTSVCECEYCGSKQTIPTVDDEKLMKLYDRANRLRMSNEFDKAAGVYESIIEEADTQAEAYWGLLLCKYGIEYVDDPASGNKIPTCHRSSFDSILDDQDFEMVMENSDTLAKSVYRENAKQIEEIRKKIIEVSGKEEPYDIFICYKETDENGDRTIDSVMAQDVYDALTGKGYRVFFSRISLEDKLGTEYEPYIFAALNSAKIMLAFGTSYDYYNAVWVKNEWSRYLKLMVKDKDKHLIPCYKDIDAYDMPKEFKHLQAQDMGKIGAVQDLTRGIDKIIGRRIQKRDVTEMNSMMLTRRGFMALEDKLYGKAEEFFEKALNLDVECGEAYLGKYYVEYRVSNLEELLQVIIRQVEVTKYRKVLACETKKEHIKRMVDQYHVEKYYDEESINKEYDFNLYYKSRLIAVQNNIQEIKREIQSNKNLTRACQFAGESDNGKKVLSCIEQALIDEENKVLKEDIALKNKTITEYDIFISKIDTLVKEHSALAEIKREKDYENAVNAFNMGDMQLALSLFGALLEYKDGKIYYEKTKEYYQNAYKKEKLEKELREQEEKRNEEEYRQHSIEKQFKQREKENRKRIFKIIFIIVLLIVIFVIAIVVANRIDNEQRLKNIENVNIEMHYWNTCEKNIMQQKEYRANYMLI